MENTEISKVEALARQMYDHYCMRVGGKAFNGDQLPLSNEFFTDESKGKQADAWRSVSQLVILQETDLGTDSPGPYGALHLGRGSFGEAIRAAEEGHKVARSGWNGSGMFAYIVPANSYPPSTQIMKDYFKGENVPYRAYWALKTAQDDVATWAPSGSDSLAHDWMIVE